VSLEPPSAAAQVRRGRPGDAASVLSLLKQLGYSPEERSFDETFALVVRHPEAAVFIANEGVRVIGYLALSQRPQIRLGGRLAVVDELVVEESRRGTGIGSALLDAAVAFARGLGCVRIELVTARVRESYVRGFYARRGFREADSAILRLELSARGK
jgi:GNAT superfamily N-acetyltransferase